MGKLFSGYPADTSPTLTDLVPTQDAETGANRTSTLQRLLNLFFNAASIPADYLNGWIAISATLSYTSWDSTNKTGVMGTTSDLSGSISVGTRGRISQATGGTKYYIVTAINTTTITGYFGTDYTLTNETVSSPCYSGIKAPYGFPLDPTKWTVTTTDTSSTTQTSPVSGTWYNINSDSVTLPIGAWKVNYAAGTRITRSATGVVNGLTTLSTVNNTESDSDFTASFDHDNTASMAVRLISSKDIVVTSATQYFLNFKTTQASMTGIRNDGSAAKTIIKAICAYL